MLLPQKKLGIHQEDDSAEERSRGQEAARYRPSFQMSVPMKNSLLINGDNLQNFVAFVFSS